jgi:hypothetical protein
MSKSPNQEMNMFKNKLNGWIARVKEKIEQVQYILSGIFPVLDSERSGGRRKWEKRTLL